MKPASSFPWLIIVATAVCLLTVSVALSRLELSPALRLAIAGLPIALYGLALWLLVRLKRGEDEMLKRIQFEALAWAFPVALFSVTALGYVIKALEIRGFDFVDASLVLLVAYAFGLRLAEKRYR